MQKQLVSRTNTSDITASQAVDMLLERALERGASDVHLDPREHNVVVRYRLDGWLQEAAKFPLVRYEGVTKQIKRRAGLDTAAAMPQNGSYSYESSYGEVVIDTATLPTVNGEKIVMHLKPQLSEAATLANLGYWGDTLRAIEYAVAEPHGLVLASSPNKTSVSLSLLALVHLLNNPALDVATLESPVTQRIPGVSQTDLKPGASFASYLEATLKQDPNVVMVGSLQDPVTVNLSVQAALNGRLLLAGVHAGNSAQAIRHAVHMHHEPFMVAAALKAVLSQHFVRRLCLHCREAYLPNEAERKELSRLLADNGLKTLRAIQELEQKAIENRLGSDANGTLLPAATTEKRITHLWKASHHGCQRCHFTGYFGRTGLSEAFIIDEPARKAVAKGASAVKLRALAIEQGMVSYQVDGFIKALRGLTSIDEVFRLTPHA